MGIQPDDGAVFELTTNTAENGFPFAAQSEDKVFRLRHRKRNAGRFAVLAVVGVVTYGRGRERLGVPLSARSKLWGFPAKGNDGGLLPAKFINLSLYFCSLFVFSFHFRCTKFVFSLSGKRKSVFRL